MADMISRAAAIDAIVSVTSLHDVDSIKSIYNIGNGEEWVDGVYDAIKAVEEVNAVDAIPVEWLKQKTKHPDSYTQGSAKWMLGCWKREQEAQE